MNLKFVLNVFIISFLIISLIVFITPTEKKNETKT